MSLLQFIDPRLREGLQRELEQSRTAEGLARGVTVVLAGHRAAGKSTLLPHIAALLGRDAVDLDLEVERRFGRPIRAWFESSPASFRAAEREAFSSLKPGLVVAVGGGFLSNHADLLHGLLVVLVPVSFETYAERLAADVTRPRLLPHLSVDDELRTVFSEREALHGRVKTMSLVQFIGAAARPWRPRRVVTLPPGVAPLEFATRARRAGAELLELRTDLLSGALDVAALSTVLPVLVAERGGSAPSSWLSHAQLLDAPTGTLRSLHADRPLTTEEALSYWRDVPDHVQVKHVEPLGPVHDAKRLFVTQRQLLERLGSSRVTVLATGPSALPFRALLAERNALDYLALDTSWAAAPGQRLVADAVRSNRGTRPGRLGIIGGDVSASRSPRVHAQPFDRISLPVEVELELLLEALAPHYRGFAVTNPFKRRAAAVVGVEGAVNTLVRRDGRWLAENTDVEGARVTLDALGTGPVTVLGEGGVAPALSEAARQLGVELTFVSRVQAGRGMRGNLVWTWPASVDAPTGLRLDGAKVAVIAYGAAGRSIAATVCRLGGQPLALGARWFIAQARRQRAVWEAAE